MSSARSLKPRVDPIAIEIIGAAACNDEPRSA